MVFEHFLNVYTTKTAWWKIVGRGPLAAGAPPMVQPAQWLILHWMQLWYDMINDMIPWHTEHKIIMVVCTVITLYVFRRVVLSSNVCVCVCERVHDISVRCYECPLSAEGCNKSPKEDNDTVSICPVGESGVGCWVCIKRQKYFCIYIYEISWKTWCFCQKVNFYVYSC